MATNWTDGYQTEVNYTYGYYKELSPNFQKFCLLVNGIDTLNDTEQQQHCELGFGQGVSINVHAASSNGLFYGTDFNPAHAAHANMLAKKSKAPHHFYDASFEELLNSDLPQFDSISLHGIWSWISHENQAIILKFIRQYLKPNGIVYVSYNCLTGWAANMPIRELFHSHYEYNSKSLNPIQKVQDSLQFSEALLQQQPLFAKRNPHALQKVIELQKQNPHYLIHEYLNQDWQCFSFQQVMRTMDSVKLSYAGSSDLNSHLDKINFSAQHQEFLNSIEHPILKEQCRDYFTNSQFRRDLYIRGKNTLSPLQLKHRLKQISFVLLSAPHKIPMKISGHLGEFNLLQEIYTPLTQCFLQHDYAPLTLEQVINETQLDFAAVLNAVVILCHSGHMQPCLEQPSEAVVQQSQRLNQFLLQQASFHSQYSVLANPYSGIGIPVDQFAQLFYRAYFIEKLTTKEQFADFVLKTLQSLNLLVLNDQGEAVTDPTISREIVLQKAQNFLDADHIKIAQQLKLFA